ncbi:MAG: toll/interleukin-1 receptor domain-containing protein [Oscillospiraceae bacterium]|nr:toll/interleukin-1 receptor domain-containing protein [Oscillospiraceae bacterium]
MSTEEKNLDPAVQETVESKLVPGVGRVPFPAYRGTDPYVFVSYAHADSDRVFPLIKRFHDEGFNVWYDEGIAPGKEWSDEIANALSRCTAFVVIITPVSAPRENVNNEIEYALDDQKPFLAIHLEETELTPGQRLRMGRKQAILKYNMSEEEFDYKYIEAFTSFGLIRSEHKAAAYTEAPDKKDTPEGATLEDFQKAALTRLLDEHLRKNPGTHHSQIAVTSSAAASAEKTATVSPADYVPAGTAVIRTTDGKEIKAVANSLACKASGIEPRRKDSGFILYEGLDNASDDPSYAAQDMVRFSDMVSVRKADGGLLVTDRKGNEKKTGILFGEEIWFIGERDGNVPSHVPAYSIDSISFDRNSTPDTGIKYCQVELKDGSFRSPFCYVWFSFSDNGSAKLTRDLRRFIKEGPSDLMFYKKLEAEEASSGGDNQALKVRMQQFGGSVTEFTADGPFTVFAMGVGGGIRELSLNEIKSVTVL